MQHDDNEPFHEWRANHGLIPGLIVIGIGLLFLLHNFHIIYIREVWRYWPLALIAAGLVKLVDSNYGGGRIVGGVLLAAGAIFLGNNLGFYDVTMRELWPLFLIGLGVSMLATRIWGPRWHGIGGGRQYQGRWDKGQWDKGQRDKGSEGGSSSSSASILNEVAIFGGGKRQITAQDFEGGELTAIFGGFEIDLRQAGMTADSAVLEINAIFGGAEIRIFGGYGDETTQPNPAANPQIKRLFVRGAAVFGGVSVKN